MSTDVLLHRPGTSRVHTLNPLTKLTAATCLTVVAFSADSWTVPAGLLVFVVAPAALLGGVGGAVGRASAVLALPTVAVIVAFQTFLFAGPTSLFDLGPLTATREGLLLGLLIGARFAVLISAFLVFLTTTHPGELLDDLRQRGLHPVAGYLVIASLLVVPDLRRRSRAILDAQQARGLETSGRFVNRIRALPPLVAPMLLGAISTADARAQFLESRAFRCGRRPTALRRVADSTGQRIVRWAAVAATVGAIIASVVW